MDAAVPTPIDDGERVTERVSAEAARPEGPEEGAIIPKSSGRAARREFSLERLQKDYEQVVGLVESIQEHLEKHDRRTETLARAITDLSNSLGELPETAKAQLASLAAIHEQLSAEAVRSRKIEENLAQLPRIADAQRETMASIGVQLEASNRGSERIAGALDGFQRALAGLSEATSSSTAALRQMHADASAREERVAEVLMIQTRRFTWFAAIATALALGMAAFGLVALMM